MKHWNLLTVLRVPNKMSTNLPKLLLLALYNNLGTLIHIYYGGRCDQHHGDGNISSPRCRFPPFLRAIFILIYFIFIVLVLGKRKHSLNLCSRGVIERTTLSIKYRSIQLGINMNAKRQIYDIYNKSMTNRQYN